MNNYDHNSAKAQSLSGVMAGAQSNVPAQPAVGLEHAGGIIDRLGKQLAQIHDMLGQRHQMIYGPVPQAVDNAKALGGSGLIYELNRLSDAADQISQLASSL